MSCKSSAVTHADNFCKFGSKFLEVLRYIVGVMAGLRTRPCRRQAITRALIIGRVS